MAVVKKLTKVEIEEALVEATGYTKSDVRHFLTAVEELVAKTIKNAQRLEIARVTIEPKLKAATKERQGRNPATGAEITIAAKKASVKVTARVGKQLQEAAPSTRKLQSALGLSNGSKDAPEAPKSAQRASTKGKSKVKDAPKRSDRDKKGKNGKKGKKNSARPTKKNGAKKGGRG